MLSSHGGFLTFAMIIIVNNLIKLTHFGETEKMSHDSQIFRAKENLKLSHSGPSYSQASGTNPSIKALKVSNGAKIRNRYNQVPHLTQDTNGKVTNSQKTPQTRAKILNLKSEPSLSLRRNPPSCNSRGNHSCK